MQRLSEMDLLDYWTDGICVYQIIKFNKDEESVRCRAMMDFINGAWYLHTDEVVLPRRQVFASDLNVQPVDIVPVNVE